MILDVHSITMTGLVRKTNQDSVFSASLLRTGLFVVADGMGGHFQGEIASGIVSAEISKWWEQNRTQVNDMPFYAVVDMLEKEIRRINNMIVEQYRFMGQMGGTTFCALLIHNNAYAVFNIGDSRLYLCTKNKVKQLTADDVWENLPQVRSNLPQVGGGQQTGDFLGASSDRRMGKLVRAMGVDKEISTSILTNAIEKKMVFFLCSDGVYKHIQEKQMCRLLKKVKRPGDAAAVNEKIREKVYDNGASDNLSMVMILAAEDPLPA